jgi:heme oxygenase
MNLPVINSLGRLVGALYVLEGSTLGGQLISRQLNQHLGLTLNTGARFLRLWRTNSHDVAVFHQLRRVY